MNWLDYNSRLVLVGTSLLGISAGLVGTLMLLRKRALLADVASHAALPGIVLGYMIQEAFSPGAGKSTLGLLLGAAATSVTGMLVVHLLQRTGRLREDASLAITLGAFFGAGVLLLTIVQAAPHGSASGLTGYLFGRAAAMTFDDLRDFCVLGVLVLVVTVALLKELTLLCFDAELAVVQGWPVQLLDAVLTTLVIAVCLTGMQSVGLLLVLALMVLPATAAGFWSHRLATLLVVAPVLGALSGALGTVVSASVPHLATGATIALCGTFFFTVSLLAGPRGVLARVWHRRSLIRAMNRDDLLRACYETLELKHPESVSHASTLVNASILRDDLLARRDWSNVRLQVLLRQAALDHLLRVTSQGHYSLTTAGAHAAMDATRRHRLWEQYLIEHADFPHERVDREADLTEHALPAESVRELARLFEPTVASVPASVHQLPTAPLPNAAAKPPLDSAPGNVAGTEGQP